MAKLSWSALTCLLIAILAIFTLLNWHRFPFFVDIYYHLNVMRGFDAAGGVVGRAFWELAPGGNTHIYPPLLHLLLLIPFKAGIDIMSIARFFSVSSFVILLAVLCFVIGRLFSKKTAFFVVLASSIPYTFFLKSTITIPVTISLILILLAYYALETDRKIACPVFLSLSFYTHLGMPWLGLLAFIIYGLIDRRVLKKASASVLLALIIALPVIINILANIGKLENVLGVMVTENRLFELYPLIYLFAAIGIAGLRDPSTRKRCAFFIALMLAMLPMAINYRFRLLSGEGMLPVLFFTGLGMEKVQERLQNILEKLKFRPPLMSASMLSALVLICAFSPTISLYSTATPGERKFELFVRDSTLDNLSTVYKKHIRPFEICLVDDEAKDWAKIIEKNTAPDDIILSNWAYMGGVLSALTGRPNSAQLFYEVKRPSEDINEFAAAKLAVFLRETDGNFDTEALKKAQDKYGYRIISQTPNAFILLKGGSYKARVPKAAVRTGMAFLMLFLMIAAVVYDFVRPRKIFNNLSRSSLE